MSDLFGASGLARWSGRKGRREKRCTEQVGSVPSLEIDYCTSELSQNEANNKCSLPRVEEKREHRTRRTSGRGEGSAAPRPVILI